MRCFPQSGSVGLSSPLLEAGKKPSRTGAAGAGLGPNLLSFINFLVQDSTDREMLFLATFLARFQSLTNVPHLEVFGKVDLCASLCSVIISQPSSLQIKTGTISVRQKWKCSLTAQV